MGVIFLATEYSAGTTQDERIDTLGIDENGSPVIIEYKRTINENAINRGLYYLDWLLDHKAEFELLYLEKTGKRAGENIDWSVPRLLCIAADFTKYDLHAVQQINRNVELIRYRQFGRSLLLLQLVNVTSQNAADKDTFPQSIAKKEHSDKTFSNADKDTSPQPITEKRHSDETFSEADKHTSPQPITEKRHSDETFSEADKDTPHQHITKMGHSDRTFNGFLESSTTDVQDRYESLKAFTMALGDGVQLKITKLYAAFRRKKNFITVEIKPKINQIVLYLRLNPDKIILEEGFTRDVRNIGHWGTGDLEIVILSDADLERAKPLIIISYDEN